MDLCTSRTPSEIVKNIKTTVQIWPNESYKMHLKHVNLLTTYNLTNSRSLKGNFILIEAYIAETTPTLVGHD